MDPHQDMVFKVNKTVPGQPEGSGEGIRHKMVQPLIGKEQKFDVVATVWARAPEGEEMEWRNELVKSKEKEGVEDENALKEYKYRILERPLFSDIVFRGMTLKDKGQRAEVPLRIPVVKLYVPWLP